MSPCQLLVAIPPSTHTLAVIWTAVVRSGLGFGSAIVESNVCVCMHICATLTFLRIPAFDFQFKHLVLSLNLNLYAYNLVCQLPPPPNSSTFS